MFREILYIKFITRAPEKEDCNLSVNWVKFQEEKILKLGERRAVVFEAGLRRGRVVLDLFSRQKL